MKLFRPLIPVSLPDFALNLFAAHPDMPLRWKASLNDPHGRMPAAASARGSALYACVADTSELRSSLAAFVNSRPDLTLGIPEPPPDRAFVGLLTRRDTNTMPA